jgi:hypothetical protein
MEGLRAMDEREMRQEEAREERKELERGVALKVAYLMMITSKKRVAAERHEWKAIKEAS